MTVKVETTDINSKTTKYLPGSRHAISATPANKTAAPTVNTIKEIELSKKIYFFSIATFPDIRLWS
jgi:hypothetical protein